jgi:hypothetical protein
VWRAARRATFSETAQASPLARTPYTLRHACVSTWRNGGVPAPQVAEWAGHSVEVLLKVYAKCLDGQDEIARRRVQEALGHTGSSLAASFGTHSAQLPGDSRARPDITGHDKIGP